MATVYKLTDENHCTYGGCQWGEGVEHTASGKGEMCDPGWLHAYSDPLLAVLFNPIHANFKAPILWECDGDVGADDGLKIGCTRLRTLRQIPLPEISIEARARFAIYCAAPLSDCEEWQTWADRWLSGEDRSAEEAAEAAWAAWGAAERAAAEAAARAAERAAEAARAAARAAEAEAAEAAARAEAWVWAEINPPDFLALISQAIGDEAEFQALQEAQDAT
jgi:hypothetical protein